MEIFAVHAHTDARRQHEKQSPFVRPTNGTVADQFVQWQRLPGRPARLMQAAQEKTAILVRDGGGVTAVRSRRKRGRSAD